MRRFGRGLPITLLVLFVMLCAVVGLEVVGRQTQPADLSRHVATPMREGTVTVTKPPNQRDAWFREIISRPLFSPDRRPIEISGRSLRGLPRLAGIVVAGSRRIAIFAAPSGGHPIVVEAGSRVGAYDVRDVADTGVTVVGPEGTTVVRPVFDASPRPSPLARPELPKAVAGQTRPGR